MIDSNSGGTTVFTSFAYLPAIENDLVIKIVPSQKLNQSR